MPHEDSQRHTPSRQRKRTTEHRVAGGHHRKSDGCLGAAVLIVGLVTGAALGAGLGVVEIVRALI